MTPFGAMIRLRAWGSIHRAAATCAVVGPRKADSRLLRPRVMESSHMGSEDHAPNHHERPMKPEPFRALVDVAPDLLLVLSLPSGKICDANQTACERLGIERASLLESMAGKWIESVSGQFESVLEHLAKDSEGSASLMVDLVACDGRRIPSEVLISAASFEGEPAAVVAARDMTDRFVMKQALVENEAKYRALVETSSDWIWEVDSQGVYTYSSPKVEEFLGFCPGEVVGRTPFDLMRPDEAIRLREKFYPFLSDPQPFSGWENINLHKDGHEVVLETSGVPILDAHGRLQGYRGVDRDITERKEAQEALRQSEALYRTLFERSADAVFVVERGTGRYLDANAAAEHLTGRTLAELKTLNTHDVSPEGAEERLKTVAASDEGTDLGEVTYLRPDGTRRSTLLKIVPRDENTVFGIARDITGRKRTEEALESRLVALTRPFEADESIDFDDLFNLADIQKLQDLFAEAAGVASIITRPDGTPITRPSNFCRLCSDVIRATSKGLQNCYCSDAIIGRHNPDGPTVQTCLSGGLWDAGASITAGGRHVANWLIGQVRNETQNEESARQYALEIGADVEAFLTAFREVPTMSRERFGRIAQTLFVLANQLSNLAFQNIQQARFITDRKHAEENLVQEKAFSESVIDSLPAIFYLFDQDGRLRRWNKNFERVSGYTANELLNMKPWDFFADDDKQYVAEEMKVVFETGQASPTADFVSKDGRVTPHFFTGVRVELNGTPFLAGVGIDITERKLAEAEREKLIAELEARNAELERFTYTVSHDLKSPLITIKGYIGMLAEDLREGNRENVDDDIQRIATSADKMADLLKELLELSRIGRIVNPSTEFGIDEVARDAVAAVGGSIAERHVQVHIGEDLPIAYGDRQRFREVLQNLIENSVKYMGDQPSPTVRIGAEPAEGMILVHVQDNGIGIESPYHERIFGLFDQLDARSDGTGIGLALVKRIVEVHGGRIWVESEGAGTGSTFCFTIPAPPAS